MQEKVPTEESLNLLKISIQGLMPVLDSNLGAAYSEYMAGDLNNGAYQYVLSRHTNASTLALSEVIVDPMQAFSLASFLFIDLRSGINGITDETKKQEVNQKFEYLKELYSDNGFTGKNPIFDIPVMPEALVS
jgi:hypothetical protein